MRARVSPTPYAGLRCRARPRAASKNPGAGGDDGTLGLVDFSIFPHLDSPDRTMAEAEQWAAGIKGPAYAIDSQTAIKVADGSAEVISEGYWKLFNAAVLRSVTLGRVVEVLVS